MKGFINNIIQEFGLKEWKQGMENMPTLSIYREKEKPQWEEFYDGTLGSEILFKARTSSLEVNDRTYRYNELGSKTCQACSTAADETITHMMNVCEAYDEMRGAATDHYKSIIGNVKFREVIESENFGASYFLGFKDAPRAVIEVTKALLCDIWKMRDRILKELVI